MSAAIPPRLFARVEHALHKRLHADVGPHLQRLAAHAASEQDFIAAAARLLVNPRERDACLAAWTRAIAGDVASAPAPLDPLSTVPHPPPASASGLVLDAAALERLRHALARELGPIAARLVLTESARAHSVADLVARLQAHLDDDTQRERFRQAAQEG